jgi:hypothetical protein
MDLDETLEQEQGSSIRPPPRPAHLSKFTGDSRKNWEIFEAFIGLHFDQYPSFFAIDRNRVTRASDYLDDAIKLDWARYVKKRKETTQGYPDWQEFSKWCKRHVENPRVTYREADLGGGLIELPYSPLGSLGLRIEFEVG